MVALVVSTVILLLGLAVVMAYMGHRPVGASLSWGEAMAASAFVFFLMFFAYGVVPHQWLTLADNELNWRADRFVFGPGDIIDRLPFTITYRVVRDIVAAGIYIVFLGGQIVLWSMWQNRGKVRPAEIETSSFGRPLVKSPTS